MNKFFYIIILAINISSYSQSKFTLSGNNVVVEFNLSTNENFNIKEKIKITNLSNESVYVPNVKDYQVYFFSTGTKIHSYIGIMNSLNGYPNLGGKIELFKFKPKELYEFEVEIKNSSNEVKGYTFSIDFIKGDNKKYIYFENGKYWIKVIDYVKINSCIYSKQE